MVKTHFLMAPLLAILAIGFVPGCSNKENTAKSDASVEEPSDSQVIVQTLATALERWKYGDKAALYDLEFPYIREQYTFDEYLEQRRIAQASADSLKSQEIKRIEIFPGGDSAYVYEKLTFEGFSGKLLEFGNYERLYRWEGRWIRPTLGSIDGQREADYINKWVDSLNKPDSK